MCIGILGHVDMSVVCLTLNTRHYETSKHLQMFSSLQDFTCQKICFFKFPGFTEPKSSSRSLQDPIIYLNSEKI